MPLFAFTNAEYTCKGCIPGETFWEDDFESYLEGENLKPYGYQGSADPLAVGGRCQNRGAVGSGTYAWRNSPFDQYLQDTISFFCTLHTENTAVVLALGEVSDGLGEFLSTWAQILLGDDGTITCSTIGGDVFVDPVNTGSVGDMFQVVATKTGYSDTTIDFLVSYFWNQTPIHETTATLTKGSDIGNGFELDFCSMGYGVAGGPSATRQGLSDNWNLLVEGGTQCLFQDLYICPNQSGIQTEIITDEVVGNQKQYRIKASCSTDPTFAHEFDIALPCGQAACGSIDLSSIDFGTCGTLSLPLEFGNTPWCCMDGPPVCDKFDIFIPAVAGFVFTEQGSNQVGNVVTHTVLVTCDPPGLSQAFFDASFDCRYTQCKEVDLSAIVLTPCGSPGAVVMGNDISCIQP